MARRGNGEINQIAPRDILMIFLQQARNTAIKQRDIGISLPGNLEYKIIHSRNIPAANNDANFHDASSLICLTTFFPDCKTCICNGDHIMRIKLRT